MRLLKNLIYFMFIFDFIKINVFLYEKKDQKFNIDKQCAILKKKVNLKS